MQFIVKGFGFKMPLIFPGSADTPCYISPLCKDTLSVSMLIKSTTLCSTAKRNIPHLQPNNQTINARRTKRTSKECRADRTPNSI